MRAVGVLPFALFMLQPGGPWALAGPSPDVERPAVLRLHANLPKDPLLVLSASIDDPERGLGELLDLLGNLGSAEQDGRVQQALESLETTFGISLQDDFLSQIGPEITLVVDLPPIDRIVAAFQEFSDATFPEVLGKIGIVADVRDAGKLDRSLRALFETVGGEATETRSADIVCVRTPISASREDDGQTAHLAVYYAIRKGRLALGFTSEWVADAFRDRPSAERLGAGADFARVFAHLDRDADRLLYVNLPKVRQLVDGSELVRSLLSGNPESRKLFDRFFGADKMSVGIGSTAVDADGGVRTTHFGPPWLGSAMAAGLLSALSLPTMASATPAGGNRATLDAIRPIATACEGFSSDTDRYPGPTKGWVPVSEISTFLEPVYIPSMPGLDAFDNPILYWSDGRSYRVLSMGRDGRMDQDWSAVSKPGAAADMNGDIVLGNGHFMILPDPLDEN